MPQVSDKDVAAIKEWLAQESYLPKDIEDLMIQKFLFSCHCSLEKTKRCIEKFCSGRASMSEIFTNRDPLSTGITNAFSITCVATYIAGTDEILIHQLTGIENFDFYNLMKSFTMQSDNWLRLERNVLPENHIIIIDMKEYSLSIIPKCNIFYYQKFLTHLIEALPIRLKAIHLVNCPPFTEYMYGLIKGVLPQSIRDMIAFHTDHMGLHKSIDKKYLPSEYDGEAGSMSEQSLSWVNEIKEKRKFYLNEDLWKADLDKKGKAGGADTTMSGSFRTLAID